MIVGCSSANVHVASKQRHEASSGTERLYFPRRSTKEIAYTYQFIMVGNHFTRGAGLVRR